MVRMGLISWLLILVVTMMVWLQMVTDGCMKLAWLTVIDSMMLNECWLPTATKGQRCSMMVTKKSIFQPITVN